MAYFLRSSKKKKGTYLQIYNTQWDSELKQPRSKHFQSIGYVDDLVSDDIPDPVAYYKEYVKNLNDSVSDESRPRAFRKEIKKNIGYFLLKSLIDELNVKDVIDTLASQRQFQFSIYDMMTQLIYSRVIQPCSKSKTANTVFPMLYNSVPMSDDQVLDGCNFIGESYKKYIELFNHSYEKIFKRNFDRTFFDCTNYYFEIDLPCEDKQKGPSKENQKGPIIGQALLLDSDLVPLAMQMYPGNESEKPYIRKIIEEMKQRYKVEGKTVQVADKGLNCARNIYAAVKEANDGYIFSKSIHGRGLSDAEKTWLILENDKNVFTDYKDSKGNVLYRLKSCIDTFNYHFKETDPDTGVERKVSFSVKEKRVVSYNPKLAAKQKAEIQKMIDKAANYTTYKKLSKEELGESAKYISIKNTDAQGNTIKPKIEMNQQKIDEDMKYAGYNLMVTSEIDMEPLEIYETYHNLWKIEESFRITKSYLDGRPVYVQKKETIYGHFLICYLSLFLLRVLEIKCFKNKINTYDLIEFIRDFYVVDKGDNTYINISSNQRVNELVKGLTGLSNLDALFLTQKEVDNIMSHCIVLE